LSTCDQPLLTETVFKNLIHTHHKSHKGIILSKYKAGNGIPSFFHRKYLQELTELKGDDGAKKIVKDNLKDVSFINFPDGNFDIDTPKDLKKLVSLG